MADKRGWLNERGASMIEVMGVLSILAIITVGALAGYNKVLDMYRQTKGLADVKRMIKDVNSFCGFERPCRMTTEKAYKLQLISGEYYDEETGNTFSPFGSDYSFRWVYGIGSGADACTGCAYYSFQHTAMPVKKCVDLLTADWNDEVYTRLYKFTDGSNSFLFHEQKGYTCSEEAGCYYLPMDLTKATEICATAWENAQNASDGEVNYAFQWYFI